jgi:hypothetical protein
VFGGGRCVDVVWSFFSLSLSTYERCVLRGDDVSEIKVVLKEILADAIPAGED